jgi:hypothetical protein
MSDPKYHDRHAADIYRAIALRFYCRYVDMRHSAENFGADLTASHGKLPTELDATEQYTAALEERVFEQPETATAALALVEFAGSSPPIASSAKCCVIRSWRRSGTPFIRPSRSPMRPAGSTSLPCGSFGSACMARKARCSHERRCHPTCRRPIAIPYHCRRLPRRLYGS